MLACGPVNCSLWWAIKFIDRSKQVALLADSWTLTSNAADIPRWPARQISHHLSRKIAAEECSHRQLTRSSACHVHSGQQAHLAFQSANRRGFRTANTFYGSRQESRLTETAIASGGLNRCQQRWDKAALWQLARLQLHSTACSDVGWIRRRQLLSTVWWWQQTQLRLFGRALRPPPTAPKTEVYLQLHKDEPVRLVAADGSHRVLAYGAALEEARSADADLIVVARHANPPVVKLGEAQRELFQQRQKEKELKRRQLESRRAQAVKEVRVGAKIAEHDLERQLKLARGFVDRGYKVKLLVVYPRRMAREGISKLEDIKQRAQDWAAVAAPAANERVMANAYAVMLTPRATVTAEA